MDQIMKKRLFSTL